ncbi:MAG: MATE family efflux transporter [Clostridiales bacterium]|nr:MATE family efflux transporter [Clostridiales bacterium]
MLFTKKDLKKLIIPLIIERVLAITVGMADTMMVSVAGDAAISGVSLVDMVNNLLNAVFAALATGGAVVTAQFIGAKKKENACESAKQLLYIATLISIGIMALCLIFKRPVLTLLFGSIEEDVMQNALIYFMISALSFPFLAIYNSGASLFRAMGNSKISMQVSLYMNIINVVGNFILVYGLKLGVVGVAVPSLISRVFAAVVIFYLLRKPSDSIYIKEMNFKLNRKMIKQILYIGIPSGLESGIFQFGRVIVVSIIAGFGTAQIAANGVANSLDGIGCIAGQSIGLAMITVVGQCVGASDAEQVKYYTKRLVKMAYKITFCVNTTILILLPWILKLYSVTPEAKELSYILVMIHNGMAMLLWPSAFTLGDSLRACNDVKFAMCLSIFSMFMFRIFFSVVIGIWLGLGAIGVWSAMVIDWIFRATCFWLRFKSGAWKKTAGLIGE